MSIIEKRIAALEARCHELEHDRARGVQSQIADLQERMGELEKQHSGDAPSEVRYAPVDSPWVKRQLATDHRDTERPVKSAPKQVKCPAVGCGIKAPMMLCELAETCAQSRCQSRVPHPLRDNCALSCCARNDDGGRCVPVPAQEPEKPAPQMWVCERATECKEPCPSKAPHRRNYVDCPNPCDAANGVPGARCIPVPTSPVAAPEPKSAPQMVRCADAGEDCSHPREGCPHKQAHSRGHNCNRVCAHCVPVPAPEPVKPAPEMVRCEDWQSCSRPCTFVAGAADFTTHRQPHVRETSCICAHEGSRARCVPVPVSPEPAIPDVPVAVGTEAFRRELQRHSEELGHAYLWLVHGGQLRALPSAEHLERLAGVACTLRDAYELARTGKTEEAEEKLKEIEW